MKLLPPYEAWSIARDPETKWACLVVKSWQGTGVTFVQGKADKLEDFGEPESCPIPERTSNLKNDFLRMDYAAIELLRQHVNKQPLEESCPANL